MFSTIVIFLQKSLVFLQRNLLLLDTIPDTWPRPPQTPKMESFRTIVNE